MTESEHLLIILLEECAEVQREVSKALRFGLDDHEPGKIATNRQRIREELHDLIAGIDMLVESGIIEPITLQHAIEAKKIKVLRFLDYSEERGTLQRNERSPI